MDELKDKINSLFKPKPKKAGFKGQGHRLGNAEPTQPQPQAHPAAQTSTSSQQRATLQQPHAAQHVSKVEPRQELKPATEFSPFTAVIGGGAACTTTKMNPAASPANNESAAATQPGPSQLSPPQPPPQQQAAPPVAQAEVSPSVLEEQQHCLALISSQPEAAAGSMEVLHKLLSNLMAAPQEAKFRQLRLGPDPNPKIQANILAVSGALDLLKACGFEVHEDSQDGGTFAYFLDDAKLSYVEAGLLQLQLVLSETWQTQQQQQQSQGQQQSQPAQAAAVTSATSSSLSSAGLAGPASQTPAVPQAVAAAPAPAPAAQPPVARNTLVLLPAAPDADVPDWFFQRTAAEVKAEFTALLRRRQAQQVVASKAWKDLKLGAGGSSAGSKQPSVITLRVRFPEGCFGVREAVTAVFDWVTGSLRYPGLTYELITPNRSPLGSKGSVGAADLAGAVLHFRGLSHTQRGGYLVDERGRQLPFLSDGLLAQAQAD